MISYPEIQACQICPRDCGVNRYSAKGFCGAGAEMLINLAQLHFGEEPPISGTRGSGTIFFSHCHLKCVYCQNYSISYEGFGDIYSEAALADMMLDLQVKGAHNINLVSPTHYTLQIVNAILQAKAQGLSVPIVWNSSAYEKVQTLQRLRGLVDIYMPDFKYYHGIYAKKYSFAADYPVLALAAIHEMVDQVGFLKLDSEGIANSGVIVRLLVLPHGLSGTSDILRLLVDEFGNEIPISLMAQYYPAGKAQDFDELSRGITEKEYDAVLDTVFELGLKNVFAQEISCTDEWTPKFSLEKR